MTLQEIRKQLPSGAISEIAKRAKISVTTVTLIFQDRTNSLKKQEVLQIAADFLTEHKAKERAAKEALQKALSE